MEELKKNERVLITIINILEFGRNLDIYGTFSF